MKEDTRDELEARENKKVNRYITCGIAIVVLSIAIPTYMLLTTTTFIHLNGVEFGICLFAFGIGVVILGLYQQSSRRLPDIVGILAVIAQIIAVAVFLGLIRIH